jgi:hypothetical protein
LFVLTKPIYIPNPITRPSLYLYYGLPYFYGYGNGYGYG